MESKNTFTKEQLHAFSKPLLEEMVFRLLAEQESLNAKISELTKTLNSLTEEIRVLRSERFGRHTEKSTETEHQMTFIFNESEVIIAEEGMKEEPSIEETIPEIKTPERKSHKKGSRKPMLKDVPVKEVPYELPEGEMVCSCCGGRLHRIGEDVSQRLEFHPATFEIIEEHVSTYSCRECQKIVRAPHPKPLFEGSIATPSLLAGIMNAKFVNAVPYDRTSRAFADHDVFIHKQTMARWMIMASERYFSLMYERMKEELLAADIIHADETGVLVSKDGRKAGSRSYMWVYTKEREERPVILYEYQKTRAAKHAKEFLSDYQGYLCCDGYEGYHSLGPGITVCGCWAHARRHYSNAVKALRDLPSRRPELTVAEEALRRIGKMFHMDKQWKDLPREERQEKRITELKEEVDSYFSFVESKIRNIPPKSETGKGLKYSINQKKYLLGFLGDPDIPLDNSEAERKIRNFVISRKNFIQIDTVAGAEASAVLFSMSETARANGLKPYEYFQYLLTEIPKHQDESHKEMSWIEDLLPWSERLPAGIRKNQK
ncbi:MAG: IS66 family transposase [Lachnospiraceae bacterium]|nr:IS66 family transposase [Lachnospiraceae bacterium]